MIFVSVSQFRIYLLWIDTHLVNNLLISVSNLNMKELVGAFNTERDLVGRFSDIVKLQSSRMFCCSSNSYCSSTACLCVRGATMLLYWQHGFSFRLLAAAQKCELNRWYRWQASISILFGNNLFNCCVEKMFVLSSSGYNLIKTEIYLFKLL